MSDSARQRGEVVARESKRAQRVVARHPAQGVCVLGLERARRVSANVLGERVDQRPRDARISEIDRELVEARGKERRARDLEDPQIAGQSTDARELYAHLRKLAVLARTTGATA